jgi:pimeloyl-ACP methyl ester carboxylesterase
VPTDEEPDDPAVCAPPDRGWGAYEPYVKFPHGKMTVPRMDAPPPGNSYDLYLHFHATDAVRRVVVQAGVPLVYAGLDLGEGSSGYARAFDDPGVFVRLLATLTGKLREATGNAKAHLGRVALSSWSAGFGATTKITRQHPGRVEALILLDSLYGGYTKDAQGKPEKGSIYTPPLRPVVGLGQRALAGDRFLFLSYSRTETIGYASTSEVASYLVETLKLREMAVHPGPDRRGQISRADREDLHLRGYRGADARAHCNHLRYAGEAVELLARRWKLKG